MTGSLLSAVREAQSEDEKQAAIAMGLLLYRLRQYVEVRPLHEDDDTMPEHDVMWVQPFGGKGPARDVMQAIAEHPELWAHALPKDVCVVPRRVLERSLKIQPELIEVLNDEGMNIVAGHAARARHEREAAEEGQA